MKKTTKTKTKTTSKTKKPSQAQQDRDEAESERRLSKAHDENAKELDELRHSKTDVSADLEELASYDEELYQAIKLFWNDLMRSRKQLDHAIKEKLVHDVMTNARYAIKTKSVPKTFFEDIAVKSKDDPMLKEALSALGISETYLKHMAKTNPERLLYEIDKNADTLADQYANAVQDAQSGGDRRYIEELKKRYKIKGKDSDINTIDLFFKAAEEEDDSDIPAFHHLVGSRRRTKAAVDNAGQLAAINKYRVVARNAIEAEMYDLFKAAQKATEEEKKTKAETTKSKETLESDIEGLDAQKEQLTSDIATKEKEYLKLGTDYTKAEDELNRFRDRMDRDMEDARERLRNIEDQIREAGQRLREAERRGRKEFDEENGLDEPKADSKGNSQRNTPKESPKTPPREPRAASKGETGQRAGYYATTDGRFIKKTAEPNGSRIVYKGTHFAGRISNAEFIRLKAQRIVVIEEEKGKKIDEEDGSDEPGEEEEEDTEGGDDLN